MTSKGEQLSVSMGRSDSDVERDPRPAFPSMQRSVTPGGHVADTSQPALPVYHRKFASPAPLGLMSFAATTMLLSFFNVGTRGISHPESIVSMGLATGGLAQMIAGIWEFASGNTFGATAFCIYASFWISFSILFIPWFGIQAAVPADELNSSIGIYLAIWFIITFILLMATLRSSIALISVFATLDITFLLLFAHYFTGNAHLGTAGGAFGIVCALCAFYASATGLITAETSLFVLPAGDLTRKD